MSLELEIISLKNESTRNVEKYLKEIKTIVSDALFYEKSRLFDKFVEVKSLPNKYLYSSDAAIVSVNVAPIKLQKGDIANLLDQFSDKNKNKTQTWLEVKPSSYHRDTFFKEKLASAHTLGLEAISFGSLVDMNTYIVHWEPDFGQVTDQLQSSEISFEHHRKRLVISLVFNSYLEYQVYELRAEYTNIQGVLVSKDDNQYVVYLSLKLPPLLYKINSKTSNVKEEEESQENIARSNHSLSERVITCPQMPEGESGRAIIGRCNIIKLSFKRTSAGVVGWYQMWRAIRNMQRFAKDAIQIHFCGIQRGYKGVVTGFDPWQYLVGNKIDHLPFSIQYGFQCIWKISFKFLDELDYKKQVDTFITKMSNYAKEDRKATELALYNLFHAIDSSEPISALPTFEALFVKFKREKDLQIFDEKEDKKYSEIRRSVLTPSRIIYLPPLICMRSRFLRNYDPDFSMRLSIRDDDLNNVAFTVQGHPRRQKEFLNEYLVNGVIYGKQVFDRRYEFMGCSSSQLRDFGMYLYAQDSKGKQADSIRREIGDFDKITNPAKYVARLGQAFSQPLGYIEHISRRSVQKVPDVEGGLHPESSKPYCFSDGVGTISPNLALLLAKSMNQEDKPPSAYQIRYAGFKGMLLVDNRLKGDVIKMRESMYKFESKSESLEVIKTSEARYAYLNKPFINILNQKGISSSVFLRMQLETLRKLTDSFLCSCQAIGWLRKIFGSLRLSLEALLLSGIDLLAEPFFRGVLDASANQYIKEMKDRARIPLEHDLARNMLGVMDETFTLEYGQIFVQYTEEATGKPKVLTGEVLVTKFPCMHPGDVKKLQAVDVPALNHIVDCIVFPAKGPRPHPNEMAGSDLDGDEYCVIWDKRLIFPQANSRPMTYPDTPARDFYTPVTVRAILEFYCEFVKDHGVGIIANAHLALSDNNGINDYTCMSLAAKYAVALDYAKTGQNASLQPGERPSMYPDFMDKCHEKPTYQSQRALGQLYRQIILFKETLNSHTLREEKNHHNRQLLEAPGWEKYRDDADQAYFEYKAMMSSIQRQFGIEDELSLISDTYDKTLKYICGRSEKSDSKLLVTFKVKKIFKTMKEKFEAEFAGIPENVRIKDSNYCAKASAWYIRTHELNQENQGDSYFGLPWTISQILSNLALELKSKNKDGLGDEENKSSNNSDNEINQKHDCILTVLKERDEDVSWHNMTLRDKKQFINSTLDSWIEMIDKEGHFGLTTQGEDIDQVKDKCAAFATECAEQTMDQLLEQSHQLPSFGATLAKTFQTMVDRIDGDLSKSDDLPEYKAMFTISALMTLFRYYRTRNLKDITRAVDQSDSREAKITICLSLSESSLGDFLSHDYSRGVFIRNLKKSGAREIAIKRFDQSRAANSTCFVSAVGDPRSIFKLRTALTKRDFYRNVQSDYFTI